MVRQSARDTLEAQPSTDHWLPVGSTIHCHIGREAMLVELLVSLTLWHGDFSWRVACRWLLDCSGVGFLWWISLRPSKCFAETSTFFPCGSGTYVRVPVSILIDDFYGQRGRERERLWKDSCLDGTRWWENALLHKLRFKFSLSIYFSWVILVKTNKQTILKDSTKWLSNGRIRGKGILGFKMMF